MWGLVDAVQRNLDEAAGIVRREDGTTTTISKSSRGTAGGSFKRDNSSSQLPPPSPTSSTGSSQPPAATSTTSASSAVAGTRTTTTMVVGGYPQQRTAAVGATGVREGSNNTNSYRDSLVGGGMVTTPKGSQSGRPSREDEDTEEDTATGSTATSWLAALGGRTPWSKGGGNSSSAVGTGSRTERNMKSSSPLSRPVPYSGAAATQSPISDHSQSGGVPLPQRAIHRVSSQQETSRRTPEDATLSNRGNEKMLNTRGSASLPNLTLAGKEVENPNAVAAVSSEGHGPSTAPPSSLPDASSSLNNARRRSSDPAAVHVVTTSSSTGEQQHGVTPPLPSNTSRSSQEVTNRRTPCEHNNQAACEEDKDKGHVLRGETNDNDRHTASSSNQQVVDSVPFLSQAKVEKNNKNGEKDDLRDIFQLTLETEDINASPRFPNDPPPPAEAAAVVLPSHPEGPSLDKNKEEKDAAVERRENLFYQDQDEQHDGDETKEPGNAEGSSISAVTNSNSAEIKMLREQVERLATALRDEQLRGDALDREKYDLVDRNTKLKADYDRLRKEMSHVVPKAERDAIIAEGKELSHSLGKERERTKALIQEKKDLEEQLREEKERVEELCQKEKKWAEARSLQSINEASLHERISGFQDTIAKQERELTRFSNENATLRKNLSEALQQRTQSVEEVEKRYTEIVSQLEERLEKAQDAAAQAHAHHKKQILEYDRRIAALEKEVSQETNRAHRAEEKAFELSRCVSDSSQEFQQEIRMLESKKNALTRRLTEAESKLQFLESEGMKAQQALMDRERELLAQKSDQQKHVSELKSVLRSLERELEKERTKASLYEKRVGEHEETIERLMIARKKERASYHQKLENNANTGNRTITNTATGTNATGSVSSAVADTTQIENEGGRDRRHPVSTITCTPPTSVADEETSSEALGQSGDQWMIEKLVASSAKDGHGHADERGGQQLVVQSGDNGAMNFGTGISTLTPRNASHPLSSSSQRSQQKSRLQYELARNFSELTALRKSHAEHLEEKKKMDELLQQHDVLLQMYGQKEEEMELMRSEFDEAKSIFKEQVNQLTAELEKMKQQEKAS